MNFTSRLLAHVKRLGTSESARLCGVTPRAIQRWLRGDGNPPNAATQAGALVLLAKATSKKQPPTSHQYTYEHYSRNSRGKLRIKLSDGTVTSNAADVYPEYEGLINDMRCLEQTILAWSADLERFCANQDYIIYLISQSIDGIIDRHIPAPR